MITALKGGIPDNVYNREVIPRWKERFGGASATSVEELARNAAASGTDLAFLFQMVFAVAAAGFALALGAFAVMEERPLRVTRPGASSTAD